MPWVSVQQAYLVNGWAKDVSIQVDESGEILKVEVGKPPKSQVERGILLPGLVNAHTHLEQAWREQPVPGGKGFVSWVHSMMAILPPADVESRLRVVARRMKDGGTALVSDIAGYYQTMSAWSDVGMQGVVQREFLGFDPERLSSHLQKIEEYSIQEDSVLYERPAPHAPYSTPPQLIVAALAPCASAPGSIHLAEDVGELDFLSSGEGEFADFMDEMGIDWRWWSPPGLSPVAYLDSLGCLGPHVLVVHGVHLDEKGIERLAETDTPLCLCPRSNLHIGGELPDIPALLSAGMRLCLGTDSLASCPDVDVLNELPVLSEYFPEVPLETWLDLLTSSGADALGFSHLGAIAPGRRPGLLLLEDCVEPNQLRRSVEFSRRWLVEPGVLR